MTGNKKPHVILVISDGTGVTGERVVRAALTQFDASRVISERISDVRNLEQVHAAVEEAAQRGATVLFSLVSPDNRQALLREAQERKVATIDLLGPIIQRLSGVLHVEPSKKPGLFHHLDKEYFNRTDALDFTVQHDDGRKVSDLAHSDIVFVGISRTSKTPLSIFLAYRGWRIANIPIVAGLEPPAEIFQIPRTRVIALVAQPDWLKGIRSERMNRMARGFPITYAEVRYVREELAWFRSIVIRGGWTMIDVTRKAIEETASEVVTLMRGRNHPRGSGRIRSAGADPDGS